MSNNLRHITTLLSGGAALSLLSILSAPIMSRIYQPEHFGAAALILSLSLILSSPAVNALAKIIPLRETKSAARNAIAPCLHMNVALCLAVAVPIFLYIILVDVKYAI